MTEVFDCGTVDFCFDSLGLKPAALEILVGFEERRTVDALAANEIVSTEHCIA